MRRSCCSCRCCCLSEWCSSLCRAASSSSWALSITRRRGSLVCSGWPRAGDGGPAPRTRGRRTQRPRKRRRRVEHRSGHAEPSPRIRWSSRSRTPGWLGRRRALCHVGEGRTKSISLLLSSAGAPGRSEMVRSRLSPPRSLRRSPNRRGARCPLGRRRRTCSDTARHPARSHGRDRLLDEPGGLRPGRSALLAAGAADAGIVVCGAHSIGLLRDLASRHGLIRRVAVSAFGRSGLPDAGPAMVTRHVDPLRGGCDHRNGVEFRDGAAVAELHRDIRERVRPRVRDRGLLVLHRGDLHRYLRVRVGPAGPDGLIC